MGFGITIADDAGRVIAKPWVGHLDRAYVLPGGRSCWMLNQVFAWCQDCRTYVGAEHVPPLAELDETLAGMHGGVAAYIAMLVSRERSWEKRKHIRGRDHSVVADEIRDRLAELELYREWRLLRQSPARCLTCFSTSIDPLPAERRAPKHPLTGQRLTFPSSCFMSMAWRWTYDVEGLPLPSE